MGNAQVLEKKIVIAQPFSKESKSGFWERSHGRLRDTNQPVSLFLASGPDKLKQSQESLKLLKTMRHPGILKYVDSLVTPDSVYIVTKFVAPLDTLLSTFSDLETSLGCWQLAGALAFLHANKMCHGAANASGVYVSQDSSRRWVWGGFECCRAASPESIIEDYRQFAKFVKATCTDPGAIEWAQTTLEATPPRLGPPLSSLMDSILSGPSRHLVGIVKNVEGFKGLQREQRIEFFRSLQDSVSRVPASLLMSRVLPLLLGDTTVVTEPLFSPVLQHLMSDTSLRSSILPFVLSSIAQDRTRAMRMTMLRCVDSWIGLWPDDRLHELLNHVILGLGDSEDVVVLESIRALLVVIPRFLAFAVAPQTQTSSTPQKEPIRPFSPFETLCTTALPHLHQSATSDSSPAVRTSSLNALVSLWTVLKPSPIARGTILSAVQASLAGGSGPICEGALGVLSAHCACFEPQTLARAILPLVTGLLASSSGTTVDAAVSMIESALQHIRENRDEWIASSAGPQDPLPQLVCPRQPRALTRSSIFHGPTPPVDSSQQQSATPITATKDTRPRILPKKTRAPSPQRKISNPSSPKLSPSVTPSSVDRSREFSSPVDIHSAPQIVQEEQIIRQKAEEHDGWSEDGEDEEEGWGDDDEWKDDGWSSAPVAAPAMPSQDELSDQLAQLTQHVNLSPTTESTTTPVATANQKRSSLLDDDEEEEAPPAPVDEPDFFAVVGMAPSKPQTSTPVPAPVKIVTPPSLSPPRLQEEHVTPSLLKFSDEEVVPPSSGWGDDEDWDVS